ncbi:MAG: hypothetical protein WA667_00825 [Candidatus Nitrosopolaris sp.]
MYRHDSIDFRPLITKISELEPLSVVTADKGYDSEKNHVVIHNYATEENLTNAVRRYLRRIGSWPKL